MPGHGASLWELAAPTIFVFGSLYVLGPILPLQRGWARALVFLVVWLVVARYLNWRVVETVLPAKGEWYEVGWIWLCFAVELFALFDAFILYLIFLRTTDRQQEADRYETRLRATAPEAMPSVDVYIPTYNEPIEVLEKTITGALCLDYPNFKIWVLDDGRRPWLRDFCDAKGVGYLTRSDNKHAKAGNINHALTKTNADFVAIFDADFIPQRNFLMRTMGFFADDRIGIVQVPHTFYNYDPMQTNLALRRALPDDQRFFFEAIMPSRDAWDTAFCCGSNSVTRRAALRAVGDALPTGSITEDMLLSLVLLRKGYITRYLCERLAFGLAPESLSAFFVQRQRWARGAIQILHLEAGPLRSGLSLIKRLMFLPTHWISQGLMLLLAIVAPLVFLWTGVMPFANVTDESVLFYLVPMILALAGGVWVYAPKSYFPLASQVLGTFQSFRILPVALVTLVRPFGHIFKVTPKGQDAAGVRYDRGIFWTAAVLLMLTIGGLIINTIPEYRMIASSGLLPVVAVWSGINAVVLFIVCMLALQAPARRGEERFQIDEPIWLFAANGSLSSGRTKNLSLSGVALVAGEERAMAVGIGERVSFYLSEVGFVRGTVVRVNGSFVSAKFDLPPSVERDLLIRKLFTSGHNASSVSATAWSATWAILGSIWSSRLPTLERPKGAAPVTLAVPQARLPEQSVVIPPSRPRAPLAELSARRRDFAA